MTRLFRLNEGCCAFNEQPKGVLPFFCNVSFMVVLLLNKVVRELT